MPQAKMCEKCGRIVTPDVQFCPNCGHDEFQDVELTPPWLKETEDGLAIYDS